MAVQSDHDSPCGSVSRRTFLKGAAMAPVGAGLLGTAATFAAEGISPRGKPNILLITAEDMGLQIGAYGDPTVPTPNLDRLARNGALFTRAYVTQASCSPSRASLLTGLYPHQNNQLGLAHLGYRMHRGIPSLSGLLKQRGYRTGIQGKLHVDPAMDHPFDVRGNGHSKDMRAYAASAESFLDGNGDSPFFLYVNFADCHKPFEERFKGLPDNPVQPSQVRPFPEHGEIDTPETRQQAAGYYNGVQRVDIGVGMLLDLLERKKLSETTVVIFLGDHGPALSRGKTTTYEFGVHIPFMVRWPGVSRAGLESDALVSTVDILPTLVTAAGGELPFPLAGNDLRHVLRGDTEGWRETLVTEYHTHGPGFQPQRAIRNERYKLILNLRPDVRKDGLGVDGCKIAKALKDPAYATSEAKRVFDLLNAPPPAELYDLQADPVEYHNLAGKKEFRAVEERLGRALADWRKETRDPFLDRDVFAAYKDHAADYARRLPELRKAVKPDKRGRRRVPIDMGPFQRDWADVVTTSYR